jgi:hypothetical protein
LVTSSVRRSAGQAGQRQVDRALLAEDRVAVDLVGEAVEVDAPDVVGGQRGIADEAGHVGRPLQRPGAIGPDVDPGGLLGRAVAAPAGVGLGLD